MNYIKINVMDIINNMSLFRSNYKTQSQTQSQKFERNIFNPSIERVVLKLLDKSHAGKKGLEIELNFSSSATLQATRNEDKMILYSKCSLKF